MLKKSLVIKGLNSNFFQISQNLSPPNGRGQRRGDSRPPSYGSVPPPSYEESAMLAASLPSPSSPQRAINNELPPVPEAGTIGNSNHTQ